MKRSVLRALALSYTIFTASTLFACGGGTPPPKDSDEAVASSAPSSKESAPPAESSDKEAAAAAPSASASPTPDPAPAAAPAGDSTSSGGDDPWLASHQMSPKDVLKATRVKVKAQACFRAGVKRDPSTSGEVKIRFVITNDGAVRVWRDEGSSMSDAAVTDCIGDWLKTLKFPKQKSPGDAWGVYTIDFTH